MRIDEEGRTVRRFRECLIYIARKNGENADCGRNLFVSALRRWRARRPNRFSGSRAWASGVVVPTRPRDGATSQYLDGRAQVFGGVGQRSIVLRDDPAASFVSISADAFTKHGLNLSGGVVDELHAQQNRDLVDTLLTAMASANRAQPLMIFITTADFARESICNEKHDYACKVRDGIVFDPTFCQ